MLRNPIDAFPLTRLILYRQSTAGGSPPAGVARGDKGWGDFIGLIEEWPDIDLVVFHFAFDIPPIPVGDWVAATIVPTLAAVKMCRLPSVVVFHSVVTDASWQASRRMQEICLAEGIPFFLSLRGAAQSISRLVEVGKTRGSTSARQRE
jgi:hypothetical protein